MSGKPGVQDAPADRVPGAADACVEFAVTLVHGTRFFGLKPRWTESGSPLRTHLERLLGKQLSLTSIPWSGRNTHGARSAVAKKLLAHLEQQLEHFPHAKQVVVCHSHAGNAAFYALRGCPIADRVHVVTLATPFLVARKRDLGSEMLLYLGAAVLLAGWLAMWLVERTPWHASLGSAWQEVVSFGSMGLVLLPLMLVGGWWYFRTEHLLESLSLAELDRERVLIVRAAGDEASGALSSFQFISQLCTRVFSWMVALHRTASQWTTKMSRMKALAFGLGSLVLALGALAAAFALEDHLPLFVLLLVLAAACLVVTAITTPKLAGVQSSANLLAYPAGLLLWPVVGLLSLLLLPFGWRIAMANILLDVTVEATPTGTWTTHLFESPRIEESGATAPHLAHSAVYENPRVIELVGSFVAGEE